MVVSFWKWDVSAQSRSLSPLPQGPLSALLLSVRQLHLPLLAWCRGATGKCQAVTGAHADADRIPSGPAGLRQFLLDSEGPALA